MFQYTTLIFNPTNLQYGIICRLGIDNYIKAPKNLFPTSSYKPTNRNYSTYNVLLSYNYLIY